jgi:osmotically-inducible protein OsmY
MIRSIGVASLLTLTLLMAQDKDTGKRTEGEQTAQTVTADQQKQNAADRSLTQRIRRAVVQADGMSINARNVKIISRDGKVTLRGPVNTVEEREKIEQIAKQLAGDSNVVCDLEVKGGNK